jgi:hypothetical protein
MTPDHLEVQVLHDKASGSTAVRTAFVGVFPRLDPVESVGLFIRVDIGKGSHDLHFILPRDQAAQLIDMLQAALQLVGGRTQ